MRTCKPTTSSSSPIPQQNKISAAAAPGIETRALVRFLLPRPERRGGEKEEPGGRTPAPHERRIRRSADDAVYAPSVCRRDLVIRRPALGAPRLGAPTSFQRYFVCRPPYVCGAPARSPCVWSTGMISSRPVCRDVYPDPCASRMVAACGPDLSCVEASCVEP